MNRFLLTLPPYPRIAIGAIAVLYLTLSIWLSTNHTWSSFMSWSYFLYLFARGIGGSSLILLATWSALGRGPAVVRVSAAILLYCLRLALMAIVESYSLSEIDISSNALTPFYSLGMLLLLQLPFWIAAVGWRWRLQFVAADQKLSSERATFRIAHLLVATSLLALSLGLLRWCYPSAWSNIQVEVLTFIDEWKLRSAHLALTLITLSILLTPLVWFTLLSSRKWWIVLLGCLFYCGSVTAVSVVTYGYLVLDSSIYEIPFLRLWLIQLAYFGGHAAGFTAALLALRLAGLRLIQLPRANAQPEAGMESL